MRATRTSPSYSQRSRDGTLIERRSSSPARAGSSGNSSDHFILSPSEGRIRARHGRWTAGHTVAISIFVAGIVSAFYTESRKVLRANGGSFKPVGENGFCPAPPVFDPTEDEVFGPLRRYPKFDLRIPMVREYTRLVHHYLEPWYPIKDMAQGLGHTGMISPEAFNELSTQPAVMSCGGHIKVLGGRVYFRYGGFYHVYYRLHRFLQTVKMIQDAVELYDLTDLTLEMIVNTCDHPQAFYSSKWKDRAGYPIMSTGFTVDTMDIPIPDPLDLTPSYTPDLSKQIPWNEKFDRAVFRGKTTNFEMFAGNWGANPRVRLHRMSDVRANRKLMDAHINSWSHATPEVQKAMKKDGIRMAKKMNFTQFNAFKYQIIVDGGGGSCRTCGVLRSNQMSFRQETPLFQFYEPLLSDNTHWLVVQRNFDDLPDKIRFLQRNDDVATRVVEAANEFATYACTLRGRTLYWALMLVKYQQAIMARDKIEAPSSLCTDKPQLESPPGDPRDTNPAFTKCSDPERDTKQLGRCTWFCAGGLIPEEKFIWLRADRDLKDYHGAGPP